MTPIAEAVTCSLDDLRKGAVPIEILQEAFGPNSLGILVVKDVPPEFHQLRRRVLSSSSYLANLPQPELGANPPPPPRLGPAPPGQVENLENGEAKYLTGWSLGKETLKSGQVDTLKGSFYANCAFYVDPSLDCAAPTAEFSPENFPEYLSPNVWPTEAALPGFREGLEDLCRCIIDVAVLVARACDVFASREISGYPNGYLEEVVRTSTTTKARLLHYFPAVGPDDPDKDSGSDSSDDDWCATHLDHGCLTGLTSAMFVDETGLTGLSSSASASALKAGPELAASTLSEMAASPDPAAGLYIKSRTGETVQVKIPRDCLAFQTGEALERITEGKFKAVPHFVRGPRTERANIARNTLAVFTQPNLGDLVDIKQRITFGEFARGIVTKNTVV